MSSIKFLWRRAQLLVHVRALADLEHQKQNWAPNRRAALNYDEFDEIIHFFFDDTNLAEDPEGAIGYTLCNKEEVAFIRSICHLIDLILDQYGILGSEEYLDKPEWMAVVTAATGALPILEANGVGSFK
jgi:hypothetical protein